jgi:hypothetical protein
MVERGDIRGARASHPLRQEFDRFVVLFIEKIASSPEYAAKLEMFKRDLLADRRVADFAQSMWVSFLGSLSSARSISLPSRGQVLGFGLKSSYLTLVPLPRHSRSAALSRDEKRPNPPRLSGSIILRGCLMGPKCADACHAGRPKLWSYGFTLGCYRLLK